MTIPIFQILFVFLVFFVGLALAAKPAPDTEGVAPRHIIAVTLFAADGLIVAFYVIVYAVNLILQTV